jgi:hypothetical protein
VESEGGDNTWRRAVGQVPAGPERHGRISILVPPLKPFARGARLSPATAFLILTAGGSPVCRLYQSVRVQQV